ncbi:acyl-CoA thioesterase, partial [Escherichia coli]
AAGSVASRHAGGRAVTIACDAMKFHAPVLVGDEVSVSARLVAVGNTSMTIDVEALLRARHANDAYKVTQARFVFVATDTNRQPRRVAPLPA